MKRFILILGLLFASAVVSNAQYAYPSEITSRGSKILVEGEKLSPEQAAALFSDFGGAQMGDDYLLNRKGYRTGVALSVTGASAMVLGTVTFYTGLIVGLAYALPGSIEGTEVPSWPDAVIYTGAALAISGAAALIAGIPTASVYRHRIKKATAEYNSAAASKPVVSFSPARSGIGIAMNF
jgi:hypothetical protein